MVPAQKMVTGDQKHQELVVEQLLEAPQVCAALVGHSSCPSPITHKEVPTPEWGQQHFHTPLSATTITT